MTKYNKSFVTRWIRKLRSRRSQDGEFEYKPLLILAVLEILDDNPEHPNSFRYENLFEALKKIATRSNWKIDEQQFAHPYVRLKNDTQPIPVWIPQAIEGIDLGTYEAVYPPNVKRDVPSVKINDDIWGHFQDPDARASFRQEIEDRLSSSEELPLLFNLQTSVDKTQQELQNPSDDYLKRLENSEQSKTNEFDVPSIKEEFLLQDISVEEIQEAPFQPKYSLFQVAEKTNVEISKLEKWVRIIKRKKQVIFYGPPGTGKTFIAKQLSKYLIGEQNGFLEIVQFHPAYTYEDFIQGIRPQVHNNGFVQFETVPGRFMQFCRDAENRGCCVLIIDEINRANLSHVFGELMYLLEYRSTKDDENSRIILAGDKKFEIFNNIIIIGTMNTADRSIALVDYALRRRFAFIKLEADYKLLERYHQEKETGFPIKNLIDFLEKANEAIDDSNLSLGVSFFMHKNLDEIIEDIWVYEIEPYLEECLFAKPQKLNDLRWNVVSKDLGL